MERRISADTSTECRYFWISCSDLLEGDSSRVEAAGAEPRRGESSTMKAPLSS